MTAEQRTLHDRSLSDAATGGLIGAALGAVVGGAAAGGRGAAIGAAAGLAVGATAGYIVAQHNYSESRTEQNYRAAVEEATKQADTFAEDADLAETIVSQAQRRAAEFGARDCPHVITSTQFQGYLTSYEITIKDLQEQRTKARELLTAMGDTIAISRPFDLTPLLAAERSIREDTVRIDIAVQRLQYILRCVRGVE